MKVKDLIKNLQEAEDQEAEVKISVAGAICQIRIVNFGEEVMIGDENYAHSVTSGGV